ncbi:histidine ammonia-lyase [Bacillus sp. AFS002410]|uniref:histidine ammonia-lyase n=1 Tax=Bacillus sp. AFS002410 TaxID=2033481 RepID=UPI000BF06AC2|nr:histidine ammonia-lyase [Bacillus sp. AFS002410]PEJ57599.1 histidine ammonia-lyase [Bacillus sp. AFS002410]
MTKYDFNHPNSIKEVILGDHELSINEVIAVARYGAKVSFTENYLCRINNSRNLIEMFLEEERAVYGVTTGFGSNVTEVISKEDAQTLQRNIVRSHAVSVGEPLEKEVVRAIQLMILNNIGQGYSGVRFEVLELIATLLNNDILPFVPGEGSVAYLSPEAHMALVLMGEGKAWYRNELLNGHEALERAGLKPVTFECKEGLALLNGSTSVTAFAILSIYNAIQAVKTADVAGAMSLEALKGTIKALDPRLHSVKKHEEQSETARIVSKILAGSEIAEKYKEYRLQDALSLRCIPQVHGAVKKVFKNALENIKDEMKSSSDNPIIWPEEEDGIALMGGNFDSSYVGIDADTICIGMANLAKIAERRIDRLVNYHVSELHNFLVVNPGLNNGYMIPQYTAAGLLNEIRVLSHPATIDNTSTCANQEDVVSFAYFAAKKAYQISKKLEHIIAIELMVATQALDFHDSLKPSPVTASVHQLVRNQVPTVEEDRYFYNDIETICRQIHDGEIIALVEEKIGVMEL